MTRDEQLLLLLASECEILAGELHQAILYGTKHVKAGEALTARDRVRKAYLKLVGMYRVLSEKKIVESTSISEVQRAALDQTAWMNQLIEELEMLEREAGER